MEELRSILREIDGLGVEGSRQFSIKMQDVQDIDRKLKLWIKEVQKAKTETDR